MAVTTLMLNGESGVQQCMGTDYNSTGSADVYYSDTDDCSTCSELTETQQDHIEAPTIFLISPEGESKLVQDPVEWKSNFESRAAVKSSVTLPVNAGTINWSPSPFAHAHEAHNTGSTTTTNSIPDDRFFSSPLAHQYNARSENASEIGSVSDDRFFSSPLTNCSRFAQDYANENRWGSYHSSVTTPLYYQY